MLCIGSGETLNFIQTVDLVLLCMEGIKAPFIMYEQVDDHTGSNAQRQAKNIDESEQLVILAVANSGFQIVPDHV